MANNDTGRLIDELLKGGKPEEILGKGGLLKEFTKRLEDRLDPPGVLGPHNHSQ